MRYRLPEGCDGVTLAGVALDKTTDGTVTADAAAVADLAPHGIVPVEETPADGAGDGKDRKRMAKT